MKGPSSTTSANASSLTPRSSLSEGLRPSPFGHSPPGPPPGSAALTRDLIEHWHRFKGGTLDRAALDSTTRGLRRRVLSTLREVASCAQLDIRGQASNILGYQSALFTFIRAEGVEPTNNAAERALRHGVQHRKLSSEQRPNAALVSSNASSPPPRRSDVAGSICCPSSSPPLTRGDADVPRLRCFTTAEPRAPRGSGSGPAFDRRSSRRGRDGPTPRSGEQKIPSHLEVGRALRAVGLEVTASLYRFVVWGHPSRAASRLRFNSRDGVNAYRGGGRSRAWSGPRALADPRSDCVAPRRRRVGSTTS